MPTRQELARIHIEKQNAGLGESEYRGLLMKTAGVNSSRLLQDSQLDSVLDAIKAAGKARGGWSQTQRQTWKKYAALCRFDAVKANTLLYQVTGLMSDEAPGLDQTDFDMAMAEIERIFEDTVKLGAAGLPEGVVIDYWRSRNSRNGLASRRELRFILLLWDDLCEIIGQDKKNKDYFGAFITKACHLKSPVQLSDIKSFHAHIIINALKLRLEQEHARIARGNEERKQVPF